MATVVRAIAWLLVAAAVAALLTGGHLIYSGTHPDPGAGSLGHVGMVIAGLILWLGTLILGGCGVLLLRRGRRSTADEAADV
jgi:hypothetical protein